MNNIRLSLLGTIATALVTVAASCTSATRTSAENITYSEVRNYFFNNDAPLPANPKIESQAEFDRYFSPAAFMGKDGMPTQVDFTRSFVIAIVKPATERATNLVPEALTLDGDTLRLTYRHETGPQRSYTIKPIFLLQTDRRYASHPLVLTEREVEMK